MKKIKNKKTLFSILGFFLLLFIGSMLYFGLVQELALETPRPNVLETFTWDGIDWELRSNNPALMGAYWCEGYTGCRNLFSHNGQITGHIETGGDGHAIRMQVWSKNLNLNFSNIERVEIAFSSNVETICPNTGANARFYITLKGENDEQRLVYLSTGCNEKKSSIDLILTKGLANSWIVETTYEDKKIYLDENDIYELAIYYDFDEQCQSDDSSRCKVDFAIDNINVVPIENNIIEHPSTEKQQTEDEIEQDEIQYDIQEDVQQEEVKIDYLLITLIGGILLLIIIIVLVYFKKFKR